ncbi:hypothetical protein EVAR_97559_1 [Eumeta japonica]|uniref:Uncharacterized protein n=1 Tax=Eumeta variegata TaxID=151549 RepID=A0A4C1WNA9_EUMVA|nr:hypothetical protein EVAR_97559_1 [Eumeta japonica]
MVLTRRAVACQPLAGQSSRPSSGCHPTTKCDQNRRRAIRRQVSDNIFPAAAAAATASRHGKRPQRATSASRSDQFYGSDRLALRGAACGHVRWSATHVLTRSDSRILKRPGSQNLSSIGSRTVGTTMLFYDIYPGPYCNGRRYLLPVNDYHQRSPALPS